MERGYTNRFGWPEAPKFDLLVNMRRKQYCLQLTPPVAISYGRCREIKYLAAVVKMRACSLVSERERNLQNSVDTPARAEMEKTSMLGISTGTETIVLVENEPGMRRLVSQMLVLAGYTVREAADGAEAIRLMEEGGQPADLLLADMALPAVSGGELMQRLAQQYPDLRVLLTSEHASDKAIEDAVAAGAQVLPKPFSPGALMSKVREVLDEPTEYPAARGAAAGDSYPAA